MEDPIGFDIWCIIRNGFNDIATEWISESRRELNEITVRKLVNKSKVLSNPIKVAKGLSWDSVQRLLRNIPEWADQVFIYQEGWQPDDINKSFCPKHRLYFGGSLGCHVCRGIYKID